MRAACAASGPEPSNLERIPARWPPLLYFGYAHACLAAAFLLRESFVGFFAIVVATGVFAFLTRVVWMLRDPRPAPAELLKPDWSVAHALQALVYLAIATVLGVVLAFAPASEATLRLAMAYGVFGFVGFLSQIVVGVEGRLLPLFAWLWGFADTDFKQTPPSLYRTPVRSLQAFVFFLWTLGVPLLAGGLALDLPGLVATGAGGLLLAVSAGAVNAGVVLARLLARPGTGG